jgi:transcriptional regulator with XRE-family HTH domain
MATKQIKQTSRKASKTKSRSQKRFASTHQSSGFQLVIGSRGGGQLLIRQRLGFTRPQFARLLPVSERSLAEIEKGGKPGESVIRSISQIRRLVTALEEVMAPQFIGPWLNSPNESFDGLKPLEVIERGEIDRIWQMIYELRSGTAF